MSPSNVTPIRNPAQVAYWLAYELDDLASNLPTEDVAPTYRMQPETKAELYRAIGLLQQATALIQSAVDREAARYEEHCEPDADTPRH